MLRVAIELLLNSTILNSHLELVTTMTKKDKLPPSCNSPYGYFEPSKISKKIYKGRSPWSLESVHKENGKE